MAFKRIPRVTLADGVFDQMAAEILDGTLAPGSTLPPERELSETFGVNRQAIRQALNRLSDVGLISISRGSRSRVLDWRRSGGLVLLPYILSSTVSTPDSENVVIDPGVARSIMEMRSCLGPDVARLCAERALPSTVRRILEAVERLAEADDLQDRAQYSWDMWTAMVEGADNIAYQLALNSLRVAGEPLAPLVAAIREDELRDVAGHRRLARAVENSEPDEAERVARHMLSRGAAVTMDLLSSAIPAPEELDNVDGGAIPGDGATYTPGS